jgi:hypothetical protein
VQSIPTNDVIAACKANGGLLKVPLGIHGGRLMLAIAAVESGGGVPLAAGANCGPRHEPSYDVNGGFYSESALQRSLVQRFGALAASSFGPWQMMYCNFSGAMSPAELLNATASDFAVEFVRDLNKALARFQPATLAEIGEIWNTGHEAPDPGYIAKLTGAYNATEGVDLE